MVHSGQFKKGHLPMGRSLPGHKNSKETIEKIRIKALERYRNGAVPHNKGKEHTEETKEKMKLNHPDVSGDKNPMYGKKRNNPSGKKAYRYKNGIGGYRKRALAKYGYICNGCGVNNKDLLLVHHKDKNRQNNIIENLEILCRNCHWLKHINDDKPRNQYG